MQLLTNVGCWRCDRPSRLRQPRRRPCGRGAQVYSTKLITHALRHHSHMTGVHGSTKCTCTILYNAALTKPRGRVQAGEAAAGKQAPCGGGAELGAQPGGVQGGAAQAVGCVMRRINGVEIARKSCIVRCGIVIENTCNSDGVRVKYTALMLATSSNPHARQ